MSSSLFHIQATAADDGTGDLNHGRGVGSGDDTDDDDEESDEDLNGTAEPAAPPVTYTWSGTSGSENQRGRRKHTHRTCLKCNVRAYVGKGYCANPACPLNARRRKSKGKQRRTCGP